MIKKFTMGATAALGAMGLGAAYYRRFRSWQRRWGATDEELQRTFPGDELAPEADLVEMRVITVKATPATIWPWLVQIGQGRAGFYSFDWLENLAGLKMKNARGINPDWQHLQVGDILPVEPSGKGFKVSLIEPERALVLGGRQGQAGVLEAFTQRAPVFSWAFILVPLDSERTRLISRFRGQSQPSPWIKLSDVLVEPLDFLMTRRMLLGIKQRAEKNGELAEKPEEAEKKPGPNGGVTATTAMQL
jgi:hypothetical protein